MTFGELLVPYRDKAGLIVDRTRIRWSLVMRILRW